MLASMKALPTIATVVIVLFGLQGVLFGAFGVLTAQGCFYDDSDYMSPCMMMASASFFVNLTFVIIGVPAMLVLGMAWSTFARRTTFSGRVKVIVSVLVVFQFVAGVFGAIVVGGGIGFATLIVLAAVIVYCGAVIGAVRPHRSVSIDAADVPALEGRAFKRDVARACGGALAVWLVWLGITIAFYAVVGVSSDLSDDTKRAIRSATYVVLSVLSTGALVGLSIMMLRRRARVRYPDSRTLLMLGMGMGLVSGMVIFGAA